MSSPDNIPIYQHPEWRVENSLTCPSDRDPSRTYQPTQGHRALSEDEVKNALNTLNNTSFVKQFLSVERRYADPPDPMQRIGLISFVPAKGATPNEKGVYGFAKLRGNYPTDNEASEKAEFLIRTVDSYHQIYHSYVGRPFPLCTTSDYSGEKIEIDLRQQATDSISADIKGKRKDEMRQVKEIEEREKQLLQESKKEDADDEMDHYITLRVKKAQITWTYIETQKKMEEMKNIIIKTRSQITDLEKESDTYAKDYFEKYRNARKEAGLDSAAHQDNFMKFLVEDADEKLGF